MVQVLKGDVDINLGISLMKYVSLEEKIEEINPDAMLADGLDDALGGYDSRGRAIYLIEEILGILITRDGMTEEEAQEFFDFNIECAHVGQFTPIYMWEE